MAFSNLSVCFHPPKRVGWEKEEPGPREKGGSRKAGRGNMSKRESPLYMGKERAPLRSLHVIFNWCLRITSWLNKETSKRGREEKTKEEMHSKTIKSILLTPTALGIFPLRLRAYPTATHQFLLLCWKCPKTFKASQPPLGVSGFHNARWASWCVPREGQGATGQGREALFLFPVGDQVPSSLPACEQRTEPQSSCPNAWPRGPRQNILSLGPSDTSFSGSAIVVYDVTRNLWWNYSCFLFLCPAIYYSVYFRELWETFITKPKPGENLFYLEFVMKSKHGLDFLKGSFGCLQQPQGTIRQGWRRPGSRFCYQE